MTDPGVGAMSGTDLRDVAHRLGPIEVLDPEDNTLVATVPSASPSDVRNAIATARRGADLARHMASHERISILNRASAIVAERTEDFARTIAREGIKTIREARSEAARCAETLRLSAEEARRIGGETIRFDQRPGSENRVGYWNREPLGVIAAITPFNDPLNLVAHKVGPAIAAGNAVIVKPHSATPLSALRLADAFKEAGLPGEILQVITGRGAEIGEVLASHPGVAMVTFTGGPRVGMDIARAAAGKRLVLELGANSPVIVLGDADLALAAASITSGAFSAAGQNCLHVQRVIVEESIAFELEQRLVHLAKAIRTGSKQLETTDMGPLINRDNANRVKAVIDEAIGLGGKLLTGGAVHGAFVEPTIIGQLPLHSRLAREEVFGPVYGMIRVRSLAEAIVISNAVDYGLHSAIFTRDIAAAMQAARELHSGSVMINDSTDYRLDAMPFGGVKGSGIGREGVAAAIAEMTTVKVVCFSL
ncbi:MAG TPA: aldehyde dehydrogenase family protein [Nitrospira sp.]|nr:aldehyde dehydrogenase family protein [Nitrospira sp.]